MALTCARCGTQNPDGNKFCTKCGTALVPAVQQVSAPAAVAPPQAAPQYGPPQAAPQYAAPQYAASPGPPAGYQSPYYAPAQGAPQPQIHRTPWVLIISIIVAVVVVLGGAGTVLAFALGSKHNTQSPSLSSVSSPSPVSSPSAGQTPSASPSSQPSQPSGGQTVSNDALTVVVPAGWTVINKDANSVTLQSPNADGTLTIASGQLNPPQTAQQLKDSINKALAASSPDAAPCPGSNTSNGAIAGVNGIFWEMCFTATSGGQSIPVAEPLWVGANGSGSIGYVIDLETTQDNLGAFVKAAVPILANDIKWKLK